MRIFTRAAAIAVLTSGLLAGCATPPQAPTAALEPSGPPRSVVLQHSDTGEILAVRHFTGTGYDPQAMQAISGLFRDRRTGEPAPVDPALIDLIADLRDRLGLPPETPIMINSGYRSTATNAALATTNANVAENSFHTRGQAADIRIAGVPLSRINEEAAAMQRGGYALYATHVHVDTGPVRTWFPRGPSRDAADWLVANAKARSVLAKAAARGKAPAKVQLAKAPGRPAAKPGKTPVRVAEATVVVKPATRSSDKAAPRTLKLTLTQVASKDNRLLRTAENR
ncbi:YcbK family protein [Azospirillum sp. RWY-5-1]|uniref:Murein endopeptidase K n=1 Tax=Azospirillum oleiclasticum TaxID=2735135 RepID=A0ABX2TAR4_9PROT|nr:DUF882 domain-containing protein [Azospirillum oleiclasticum]NYZ13054.1 YcbK family protein [Azospirillum oleiclasticum]NYZ20273.1 YcbK family protein [Azospirillum oleiclasticum]